MVIMDNRSISTDIGIKSNMPPQIKQTQSEELGDALKRLATLSSGRELQSAVFERVREGESIRIARDSDELSSPTVSCMSFSDDDLSVTKTVDPLTQAKHRPPIQTLSMDNDNDDLSMTSISSHALKRIEDLKNKLEIQENTKLELLHQCLRLENELERVDSNYVRVKMLKAENAELREQSAKIELDFMNEMTFMMNQMRDMAEDYEKQLSIRDKRIENLEKELQQSKITSKKVDTPCVISSNKDNDGLG